MRISRAVVALPCLGVMLLSACDMPAPGTAEETGPPAVALFRDPVEADRPAPEVFEDEGVGIWDGRPTLGGVWIAHPLATQPERVRIENLANGKTVVGALFRRDTALTGPAIQLSSDTARSIGIVPGNPTPLRIVALRRVVVAEEPAAEDVAETPAEEVTEAPAEAATGTTETVAAASTAVEVPQAPSVETTGDAPAPVVETMRRPAPRPRGPDPAVTTPAAPRLARPVVLSEPAPPSQQAEPAPPSQDAAEPAPAAAVEPDVSSPAAAEAPADAPTAALPRPFVQVGMFGVAKNAERLVRALEADGLPVRTAERRAGGTTFVRVLIGPAVTQADLQRWLETARRLGFRDAIAVRG